MKNDAPMTDITAIKARAEALRSRNERFQAGHGNFLYYGGGDSILDCGAADGIDDLLAEVKRLTKERYAAVSDLCKWRSAFQSDTPGGSEFMTPEAVRAYIDARREREHVRTVELVTAKKAAEAALAEARAENNKLRAALGNGASPCVYCGLAKEDWAKCADGFPGCGRADDAMLCPHVGASMTADEALAEAKAENEGLREGLAERDELVITAGVSDLARLIESHDAFECASGETYVRAANAIATDIVAAFGCTGTRCEDCPPTGYPTDETRCAPCDRRALLQKGQNNE